jgi:hypothetical protein
MALVVVLQATPVISYMGPVAIRRTNAAPDHRTAALVGKFFSIFLSESNLLTLDLQSA